MPEWFLHSFNNGRELILGALVYHLCAAFLLGGAVAGVYWATQRRDAIVATSFLATLVLLTILIAMLTQVIGDNLARAFSLAGVLAIVRFRTVVEDSRDSAFVIFAVIVGMAVGADYIAVGLVGIAVAGAAAFVVRPWRDPTGAAATEWELMVRVGIGDPKAALESVFGKHLAQQRVIATTTSRQGAALDLSYRVRLTAASTPPALVAELNQVQGVQQVELRRVAVG